MERNGCIAYFVAEMAPKLFSERTSSASEL